jgi:hypothetical protein
MKIDTRKCWATVLFALVVAAAARVGGAPAYTAIDLFGDSFPPGDTIGMGTEMTTTAGQVIGDAGTTVVHAFIWTSASTTGMDLHPILLSGLDHSQATFGSPTQQVGFGFGPGTNGVFHALVWNGASPASAVDLHPTSLPGYDGDSIALGTDGAQQVGHALGTVTGGKVHAFLWSGSPDSAIDLHPTNLSGFTSSEARGAGGGQQVGWGTIGSPSRRHALLWSGSANSAVDLDPVNLDNITDSIAQATNGSRQVGFGKVNAYTHALLWSGNALTAVDLHPGDASGFISTEANALNDSQEVGDGHSIIDGHDHAVVWSDTPDSMFDLQSLLPSYLTDSYATAIDAQGNIFGYADANDDPNTPIHAVEWAVPEPAGLWLVFLGTLPLLGRATHRGRQPDQDRF